MIYINMLNPTPTKIPSGEFLDFYKIAGLHIHNWLDQYSSLSLNMSARKVMLRPVQKSDCQLLWEWANNTNIRAVSFSSDPIPWETHLKWFTAKIQDPYCYYLIGIDKDEHPIGQVRFDLDKETQEAEISLSVAPELQGFGYGIALIKSASDLLFHQTSVKIIKAFIKSENSRSIRAFEKAGFYKVADTVIEGCPSLHYEKSRTLVPSQEK